MDIARQITRRVRRKNEELTHEALVDVAIGGFFTLLTFGSLLALSWVWFIRVRTETPLLWASLLTLVAIGLSAFAAWKRVDPFRGLAPMTNTQLALTYLSHCSSRLLYFSPAHAGAGLVSLFTGGLATVFEGVGVFRNRLSTDPEIHSDAASLLQKAQRSIDIEEVRCPRTCLLLRQLKLVRFEDRSTATVLLPTERGARLLAKALGASAGANGREQFVVL